MHRTREDYQRFHRRRHELMRQLLLKHVPRKVARGLDIGGGGDVAGTREWARDWVEEFHAVDQGGDVELGLNQGLLAKPCNIDFEALPYVDAFFDVVILASVMEHLYNPRHVLNEIARTLKPGGVFLIEMPNAVALGRRLDALLGKNPFQFFNEYNALLRKASMFHCAVFYTMEETEALLANQFTVLERQYAMHSPPVSPVKALIREAAFRLDARLADCFFIIAQRHDEAC